MHLSVSLNSKLPIYSQIVEQIENQILTGHLKEGELLPSIRNLAQNLKISVITTKRAYDELEKKGLLTSVAGKGTFVSGNTKELIREDKCRGLENQLMQVIMKSKVLGINREELINMLTFLYGEDE
ncbi:MULTISPECIES: GntR family transcriptional regulator [Bacillaceae]|uniref:GntR family transcriptional regulator n=1 Tax=Bacillaceae TaxID=186817 RepID=UPI001BDEAE49|nr:MULTISPECIES: GntR family transcriptional regulator [Bacillaceae]MDX8360485.1 GntR family transcriptional regulator [Cytobacillus sp. IB215316]